MVVIGIIAALLAIIVPVVAKVRESARRTACLANLRSLGQAMIAYTRDFRDHLPNDTAPGTYTPDTALVLVFFANQYVGNPKAFWCPSAHEHPGGQGPLTVIDNAYSCEPNSARYSYEFFSIWWPSDLGPMLTQLGGAISTGPNHELLGHAPLAWDNDGGDDASGVRNHDHGGNVIFADGRGEWQPIEKWEGKSWPFPAQEYLPHSP
jgi:hypothetical protein